MHRKGKYRVHKSKAEAIPPSSSTSSIETPWKTDNAVPKFDDPATSMMSLLTLKDGAIPSLLDICTNYFTKYVFGWLRMSKIYEKTYPNLPPLEFQLKKVKVMYANKKID